METKRRIVVTFSSAKHKFSGHIFEVADYAYYLYDKWSKFATIELWIPLSKTFFFRCLKLRYKEKLLNALYHYTKLRFIDDIHRLIRNYHELQTLSKTSCIISTNSKLFHSIVPPLLLSRICIPIHTFIGLHCYYTTLAGLVVQNLRILFNKRIYQDHKDYLPSFTNISDSLKIYDNYYKRICFSQLLYNRNFRKDLGSIVIDKDSDISDYMLEGIQTIIVKDQKKKDKYDRTKFRILSFPIAHFLSRISMYRVTLPDTNFDCSNRLIKECQYFDIPIDLQYVNVSCINERVKEPVEDLMDGDSVLDSLIEEYLSNVS